VNPTFCDRIGHCKIWLGAIVLACAGAGTVAIPASASANDAQICDAAAQVGAKTHDVPLDVLRALTRTETGRAKDGKLAPWPWTVNMEGAGFWFESRSEALAFVREHHAKGARSFDVGCFQINFRWHGDAFDSIDAMFDPVNNAVYAAKFVSELKAEGRDWIGAAGAYHSRTPSFASKYKDRFARIFAQLGPVDRSAPILLAEANAPLTSGAGDGPRMPGGVFASGPAHGNPDRQRVIPRGGVTLTMFVAPSGGILTAGRPLIGAQ